MNFSVRMGLNSGEVVVGRIGDDLRMDYTAQGQTVGLASRIEQLAEAGSVYLTEHTAKLVSGFFQLRDLGAFELKGTTAPVRVYELEGASALHSRIEVSRSRGFSRFVGRSDEMAILQAALLRRRLPGKAMWLASWLTPEWARAASAWSSWITAVVAGSRSSKRTCGIGAELPGASSYQPASDVTAFVSVPLICPIGTAVTMITGMLEMIPSP